MKVRSRSTTKKQHVYRILILSAIVLLFVFLLPSMVTTVSRVVLYPVTATQIWLRESTSSLPTYLRDKGELADEIRRLEEELAVAVNTDVTQQRLYEENSQLRSLLAADEEDRIAAAVVARPTQLPYDFLQIDQGSMNGIVEGAPVYSGSDTVIGVVSQVDRRFSFVELFTSSGFEATAFISGPDFIAVLEGVGSGVARVRVPQGIPIATGNLVHVPSVQPGVFGRITFIESEPTQPEQFGYITPEKSLQSLNYVAVGVEPLTPPTPEIIRDEIEAIVAAQLRVAGMDPFATSTEESATTSEETTDE